MFGFFQQGSDSMSWTDISALLLIVFIASLLVKMTEIACSFVGN